MFAQSELEEVGLQDFRVFLCEVWAYLRLPRPTKVQLYIAKWMQHAPRRVILMAFRGVGKSYLTVAFVLWSLLLDPQLKIEVVSANEALAHNFTTFCFQLINGMPLLQHLAPRADQRRSSEQFDVGPARAAKDPSVKSVSITGQITGSRADILVADDVEVPRNSQTFLLRERLSELVKEFGAVLKPGGRVIYLGTPQVEASLYRRLESRGYEPHIIPSEVPSSTGAYRGFLSPYVQRMVDAGVAPGTPVDPERFDVLDLNERRAEYGRAGYALQFMLDTTPSDKDAHPLKLHDLIVHGCDEKLAPVEVAWGGSRELVVQDLPAGGFDGDVYHRPAYLAEQMVRFQQTVMAIDPSGKGKDETGYSIVRYLNGLLYLVDVGGFLDGYGEGTLKGLAGKALRWGVNDIIIEENYGGGMFNQLLKPHLIRVFGEAHDGKNGSAGKIDEEWNGWSSTQKEMRICDTLQPLVESHRLVVDRRVIEEDFRQQSENPFYSFVYQFTRIKRDKGALPHEDRLETLSMACAYLKDKMDRDQRKAHKQHLDVLRDKELKDFARHVFGIKRPPRRTNWLGEQ